MKDWISGLAKKLGFIAVTEKSDNGENNRKPYIVMVVKEVANIRHMLTRNENQRQL
jgi:hypothetical protein